MSRLLPENGKWRSNLRRVLFPGVLLILAIAGVLTLQGRFQGSRFGEKIHDGWVWSDSSIFEFQKITLRFKADSFYMVHRFINPRDLKARLPCALADHQMYTAGRFEVQAEGVLRLNGEYTDGRFSRDTLRLCRDTGFRALTHLSWRDGKLCLGGATFARVVCFSRSAAVAAPPAKRQSAADNEGH